MQSLIISGLFFLNIVSNVHADKAPSDFCIMCTPNMTNVPCHNKDIPSEKFSCLHPKGELKVNMKEYTCENGTNNVFPVEAKSCAVDNTTPPADGATDNQLPLGWFFFVFMLIFLLNK
ncbi:hypothetical protein NDU88_010594 [Pleurodeles waltl]|uniref:Uncharacterized protein n=1 Tax=Pleurodeles waltl TaxID=8319 RepID=A0AAV7Q2D9_PLEWA|nr:hypothetical protein NDU88_010594 [Pleurodeles waltl]